MKDKNIVKTKARQRRHWLIRKRISGTPNRPRLVVFRSLKHTYAQIIDDTAEKGGHTIASVSSLGAKIEGKKSEQSFKVGLLIGEKALSSGIEKVCFDRAGYKYHGRVKAVADGARKAGLLF